MNTTFKTIEQNINKLRRDYGEITFRMAISHMEMTLKEVTDGYAFAYVWNKTNEECSEFGTVTIKSFGGGIARIG